MKDWFEVVKLWIKAVIEWFIALIRDKKGISEKEHTKSVIDDVGYFKGEDYQIIYRKDLGNYWVGSNKRNPEGTPSSVCSNLDEAIKKFKEYENK